MKRGINNSSKELTNAIIQALCENGKWMSGNEIIAYANSRGFMESKDAPRQAESHPIYRILTSMMRKSENQVKGLERRKRTEGVDKGEYEYAYNGRYDGSVVIIDGIEMKPVDKSDTFVTIGSKKYSRQWLDAHPGKEDELILKAQRDAEEAARIADELAQELADKAELEEKEDKAPVYDDEKEDEVEYTSYSDDDVDKIYQNDLKALEEEEKMEMSEVSKPAKSGKGKKASKKEISNESIF